MHCAVIRHGASGGTGEPWLRYRRDVRLVRTVRLEDLLAAHEDGLQRHLSPGDQIRAGSLETPEYTD